MNDERLAEIVALGKRVRDKMAPGRGRSAVRRWPPQRGARPLWEEDDATVAQGVHEILEGVQRQRHGLRLKRQELKGGRGVFPPGAEAYIAAGIKQAETVAETLAPALERVLRNEPGAVAELRAALKVRV